jgi:hypothetical protein
MGLRCRTVVEDVRASEKLMIADLIPLCIEACTAEVENQSTKASSWDKNSHA